MVLCPTIAQVILIVEFMIIVESILVLPFLAPTIAPCPNARPERLEIQVLVQNS